MQLIQKYSVAEACRIPSRLETLLESPEGNSGKGYLYTAESMPRPANLGFTIIHRNKTLSQTGITRIEEFAATAVVRQEAGGGPSLFIQM